MNQFLALTSIVVRDYDEAIDFYVGVLDFENVNGPMVGTVGRAEIAHVTRGVGDANVTFRDGFAELTASMTGYGPLTISVPRGAYDMFVHPMARLETRDISNDRSATARIDVDERGQVLIVGH